MVDPIPVAPVQKIPKSFSTVPFPRDRDFIGREKILTEVRDAFADPKSQQWASLYGLGGIG